MTRDHEARPTERSSSAPDTTTERARPHGAAAGFELGSAPGVLYLQSMAGNAAVADLIALQRQPAVGAPAAPAAAAAPAAPTPRTTLTGSHPLIHRGSLGAAVEELQTKLNLIPSAAPDAFLTVDGNFGGGTDTAVRAFQSTVMHMPVPDGKVGPLTWGALDAAVVGAENTPRVHPVLHLNDSSAAVGEAQEKLNAAGAAPVLSVDGVFAAPMQAAVRHFQQATMAMPVPSGNVDQPTWTALEHAAPGGGTRAARGGQSIEEHVDDPGGGHPLAAAIGSTHPTVGPGNLMNGIAVREMQQKLNAYLRSKGPAFMTSHGIAILADDGAYGPKTSAALIAFQTDKGLAPATGIANPATWTQLDTFTSAVGIESRMWNEAVGGHQYGLTSVYAWALSPSAITVTVGFQFTPPAPGAPMPAFPVATWFNDIKNTWNRFKAVKTGDPTHFVNIGFNPVQSTDANARQVAVMPGQARSDAGHFYAGDPDIANTVAHEFGHMIGLKDEYQQTAADYRASTGLETPVGQMTGPTSGSTPAQVALLLQQAVQSRQLPSVTPSQAAQAVAGMAQGAFAQRVIAAYRALPAVNVPAFAVVAPAPPNKGIDASPAFTTTGDLVVDLDNGLLNNTGNDIPNDKYNTIEILTYDSGSTMGDPTRQPDQHEHGAQPRHVREFVEIVQHARGGVWQAEPR